MSVWRPLVGQDAAVEVLSRAVAGQGMSHAWLFTGPPGSGRSNVAVAFAAALQCSEGGCGECPSCRTTLAGSHADVSVMRTEKLSLGVDDIRGLVRASALAPVGERWQIMIIEDADRLTDHSGNALLKAIEEPTPRTVWLLCAPTVEDVLVTIRSRCRQVTLATPTTAMVAEFLIAGGAEPSVAAYAARASQGHIGRAKALAHDEETRSRRREVVQMASRLRSLGDCMTAAASFVDATGEEADAITGAQDARDKAELDAAYGVVERGRRPREYAPALAALEKSNKLRAKRRRLDMIDRGLMDLVSVYRDAIALAFNPQAGLVNEELRPEVAEIAAAASPEVNVRRIDLIFAAREQMLEFNVPPALALEAMMVGLWEAGHRPRGEVERGLGEPA